MSRFQVFETPLALARYKQASTDLLAMLDQVVYPALREDPANESGEYPIRFRPGGFTFEIETPGGGLHYLVYQAIEELGRVLVLDLVTFREPSAPTSAWERSSVAAEHEHRPPHRADARQRVPPSEGPAPGRPSDPIANLAGPLWMIACSVSNLSAS